MPVLFGSKAPMNKHIYCPISMNDPNFFIRTLLLLPITRLFWEKWGIIQLVTIVLMQIALGGALRKNTLLGDIQGSFFVID